MFVTKTLKINSQYRESQLILVQQSSKLEQQQIYFFNLWTKPHLLGHISTVAHYVSQSNICINSEQFTAFCHTSVGEPNHSLFGCSSRLCMAAKFTEMDVSLSWKELFAMTLTFMYVLHYRTWPSRLAICVVPC